MVVSINNVVSPVEGKRIDPTAPQGSAPPAGNQAPPRGNELPAPPPIDTAHSIERLTEYLSNSARGLRFHLDDASGEMVVVVVNPNSGEVIRQIPSEEMLQIANALRRHGALHLVDEQA